VNLLAGLLGLSALVVVVALVAVGWRRWRALTLDDLTPPPTVSEPSPRALVGAGSPAIFSTALPETPLREFPPPSAPVDTQPTPPAPTTVFAPPARLDSARGEGEVWLEVSPDSLVLRGHGDDAASVEVRAWELVDGARVDVTATVSIGKQASNADKLWLRDLDGPARFTVHGRHAGPGAWKGAVQVGARSAGGKPVKGIALAVRVDPLTVEVHLCVDKAGFGALKTIVALPAGVGAFRARVGARTPGGAVLAVKDAVCNAALRIDGGGWSHPVAVRSDATGVVQFTLPPAFLARYSPRADAPETAFELELAPAAATAAMLQAYAAARAGLEREFAEVAAHASYGQLRERLASYPDAFLAQLSARPECDQALLVSALMRLTASVQYTARQRSDLRAGRTLLTISATQTIGAAFAAFDDFLGMTMGLFRWIGGSTVTLAFRGHALQAQGLPQLTEAVASKPEPPLYASPLAWLIRAGVWVIRRAQGVLYDLCSDAFRGAIHAAESAQLPSGYLERLRFATPGDLAPQPPTPSRTPMVDALVLLARAMQELGEVVVRCCGLSVHALVIAFASALKRCARAWAATRAAVVANGAEAALAAQVGGYLSAAADAIYERCARLVEAAIAHPPGRDPSPADADAEPFRIDDFAALGDFDQAAARALDHAWRSSLQLRVRPEWQPALLAVARADRAAATGIEQVAAQTAWFDGSAPLLELAVKVLQAILLIWATLGQTLVKLGVYLAEQNGDAIRHGIDRLPEMSVRASLPAADATIDIGGRLEAVGDAIEFVLLRLPILLREFTRVSVLFQLAPARVRDLYADSPLPQPLSPEAWERGAKTT
jgi:hypothetical protein